MFMGNFTHSLDDKGRVAIPSEWRGNGDCQIVQWVITQGFDGCLLLYTESEWKSFIEKIEKLPYAHEKNRIIMRKMISPARYAGADKQGRILIPQNLRESVGIDKEVILAGLVKRIEIWDKDQYNTIMEKSLSENDVMHLDF
jgi:MraZ protein